MLIDFNLELDKHIRNLDNILSIIDKKSGFNENVKRKIVFYFECSNKEQLTRFSNHLKEYKYSEDSLYLEEGKYYLDIEKEIVLEKELIIKEFSMIISNCYTCNIIFDSWEIEI